MRGKIARPSIDKEVSEASLGPPSCMIAVKLTEASWLQLFTHLTCSSVLSWTARLDTKRGNKCCCACCDDNPIMGQDKLLSSWCISVGIQCSASFTRRNIRFIQNLDLKEFLMLGLDVFCWDVWKTRYSDTSFIVSSLVPSLSMISSAKRTFSAWGICDLILDKACSSELLSLCISRLNCKNTNMFVHGSSHCEVVCCKMYLFWKAASKPQF